ncbi:MAG: GntR family transcriptional regulator [Anaerolineae bacterium]|nr:GntR family transcriptional regulator [Anaerolineae bacterium]
MITHDSPVPLYVQIKDYLRRSIQTGAIGVHARVPSERELAQQFNVNRLTASRALKELAQEGLIYSRVGKGTYVCPPKINQTLKALSSFSEEMRQLGQQASSRVLQAAIVHAPELVSRALSLPAEAEIVLLVRVRLADGLPIALESSHIPHALCREILPRHDFARESLYHVLRHEYGLRMTYAHQTIEAQVASEGEQRALECKPGTPILSIVRVTYTDADQPFEYVRSAYRGDRYRFHTELRLVEAQNGA